MKRKPLIIISVVFLILVLATTSYIFISNTNDDERTIEACYHSDCFELEVVDTQEARLYGLMNRTSLEKDEGMLFVFDTESVYPFWMKDTLIPLDMIWLDHDKHVVFIANDVQPCYNEPCAVINPQTSALYVIELNAGTAARENLVVGSTIEFTYVPRK